MGSNQTNLPEDSDALKALLRQLLQDCATERQRADTQENLRQALELKLQQLQHELELLKKRYYGPRTDRLRSLQELGQMLLQFAEELLQKPMNVEDVPTESTQQEPERELRWVKKRKGRRNLAAFENLPIQTVFPIGNSICA